MSNLTFLVGVQIVQVTLCIAGAALLSFGCLRKRPALAAAVWLAVLFKCATPPMWASPLGVFSWLHAEKPRTPTPLPPWIERAPVAPRPKAEIVDEPPVVADVTSTPAIAWRSVWPWMLASVWATGFAWTFSRAFRIRRRWLAAVVEDGEPPESVIRGVVERSKKLGMKPPRIVMVAADAGPAASGWFRPTIYLPTGVDPKQLESMLVHELVHLRRRDPWLGALQAFVCAAYWFHPAVRWASDELSRCIEEACDAETVCELGCKPVEYAAALVALLERRVAPPVPMVAGMSPARSVRRRLEAVMKTNPKRRGKTARGPWLAFAAATLIALPGAGLPPSPPKPEAKPVPSPEILPNPIAPPTAVAATPLGSPSKPVEIKNFSHRGYDLKPAVDVLVKQCGLRQDAACNAMVNLAIATAERIGPRPVFAIADQRLFAFAAEAQHERMAQTIQGTIEVYSTDQIIIESEIWDAPKSVLDGMPPDARIEEKSEAIAFLDEEAYKELSSRLLADKTTNKIATPKMTVLDGRDANLKIGTECAHPFDGKYGKTLVGLSLDVSPKCSADGRFVSLKVRYEQNEIGGYVPLPGASTSEKPQSKAPIINGTAFEAMVAAQWGVRIAVKMKLPKLLVFKCVKAPRPAANFNTDPPGDGKLQANADPRMKAAVELYRRRAKHNIAVTRVYPIDHFHRGNASPEQLTADFRRALDDCFSCLEAAELEVTKPGKTFAPYRSLLAVKMPVELHEALARMLHDVDTRTGNELGIPPELRGTPQVGN
jgi:beta-lactamase regulating signal transducer with metallopeptidase domain